MIKVTREIKILLVNTTEFNINDNVFNKECNNKTNLERKSKLKQEGMISMEYKNDQIEAKGYNKYRKKIMKCDVTVVERPLCGKDK